ncbi:polyprenol monophosphomannose synthase [Acidianus manzaensis]|uniref:Dolichol-phosphate mannosyltransferase n=1 Tax=Acidianus manzaensis TaxID=282676 RepID=A0A1W6K196_9CREN|nr:polyprenol monophosphomannose synthase [Acidianus manzaensis]ARM76214.1 dolichol-phosphate mannosyltransferase [Acidianus manzaensis]
MADVQVKKVGIIIPTYNEKDNVTKLISEINKIFPATILVVDDNSPDGTGRVLKSLGLNNLMVEVRETEKGLGGAIRKGLSIAYDRDFDYVVTMDADLSHDPIYLPKLYKKAEEGYDLVIGSRYIKGGGIQNWPLKRKIISKGANTLFRLLLRSPLHDNTSNYRIYSRSAIKEALQCDSANGYEFQICTVFRILRANLRVSEVPIIFKDREVGKSKLSNREIIQWFKYLIKLYLSR